MSIAFGLTYDENKLHKTKLMIQRCVLDSDSSEKGLGIVYPTHFVYDFSREMFLMLY